MVQIEWLDHLAIGIDALAHPAPQMPRRQGLGKLQTQVVHVIAHLTPDIERVAKPLRRQEAHPRAFALDDRIGGKRGAMHDVGDVTQRHARAL